MLNQILENLVTTAVGSRAAIFLDGDGEAIAQAGQTASDMKLLGAWKEIHLDRIKEITERLGLGAVKAVLFTLEEGNELIAPVAGDYCLLLFLSNYADIQDALGKLKTAIELLQKDIE